MTDYAYLTSRYSVITIIIICISLIAGLLGVYATFFLGLALGAIFSLLSLLSTYFQVKRTGNSVRSGKYKWVFGTVSRILLVAMAILIANDFPTYFHLIGVIIGLMSTYILILAGSFLQGITRFNNE